MSLKIRAECIKTLNFDLLSVSDSAYKHTITQNYFIWFKRIKIYFKK